MGTIKKYVLSVLVCFSTIATFGQTDIKTNNDSYAKAFRHLDLAITAGTTGIGIDLASPICKEVQVRAGFSFMPHISTTMHFDIESGRIDDNGNWVNTKLDNMIEKLESFTGYAVDDHIDMKGMPTFYNFNLLVDVFPFKNKHWHFTAGFYLGPSKVAKAINTTADMPTLLAVCIYNNLYEKVINDEPIYEDAYIDPEIGDKIMEHGRMGIHIGDFVSSGTPYLMEPGENSMVNAKIKVNNFKPYLGFGYGGRLVRNDERYNVSFDCGAMFWGGTPRIITQDGTNLAKDIENIRGKVGDYVSVIKGIKVYPVINLRISYRLF